MMALFSIDFILAAFLIFVRVGSMLMTAPFFSTKAFPRRIRLFFALITSFLLASVIPAENVVIPADSNVVFLATVIVLEALVGIALGLVGQLIFAGLELAGRLISLKIALGFAQMIDTMTQQKNQIVSNLFSLLAVLVFLFIDGDKVYLNALARSFEVIPVNTANIHMAGPFMLDIATYLFIIGVQISSPFLVVLFLLDLALAIFARIMPQANIMFISMPLKVGIGVILLIMITPHLPTAFEMMFTRMFDFMQQLFVAIAPAG